MEWIYIFAKVIITTDRLIEYGFSIQLNFDVVIKSFVIGNFKVAIKKLKKINDTIIKSCNCFTKSKLAN